MHALVSSWSRPTAIAVSVITAGLAGAGWAFLWFWLGSVHPLLTGTPDPEVWLPGAIIAVLYLPFLAKEIAFRVTKDRASSRIALSIAIAWAVIFSFWLSWWEIYGSKP